MNFSSDFVYFFYSINLYLNYDGLVGSHNVFQDWKFENSIDYFYNFSKSKSKNLIFSHFVQKFKNIICLVYFW